MADILTGIKTCRIYRDRKGQWCMIWYEGPWNSGVPCGQFRSKDGSSREALIAFARRQGFARFYDGYVGETTAL